MLVSVCTGLMCTVNIPPSPVVYEYTTEYEAPGSRIPEPSPERTVPVFASEEVVPEPAAEKAVPEPAPEGDAIP